MFTDINERFAPGSTIYLKSQGKEYKPVHVREFSVQKERRCLVLLDKIGDRNSAEALKGSELFITRQRAEESRTDILESDEFYYYDLAGCRVFLNGLLFGKVVSIREGGAGELLEIEDEKGHRHLVPFVEAMVDTERIREGRLDIHPVEGLLDY
jgi:16S rRNA processing protein RimM